MFGQGSILVLPNNNGTVVRGKEARVLHVIPIHAKEWGRCLSMRRSGTTLIDLLIWMRQHFNDIRPSLTVIHT